ncbi:MAG: hypothetical protein ACC655_00610 [Rhodothermia bacterium]
MTLEQLKHAIRSACIVSGDDEVWVFGSQAILGAFPDAPESLLTSIEVDLQPKNKPESVDDVDGPLGELSLFHETHGFYIHGFPIADITLPVGWETRVIKVVDDIGHRGFVGWCLEPHDLSASKLAAFRIQDRDFVRTLLVEGLIDPVSLEARLLTLEIDSDRIAPLRKWLDLTVADLTG